MENKNTLALNIFYNDEGVVEMLASCTIYLKLHYFFLTSKLSLHNICLTFLINSELHKKFA